MYIIKRKGRNYEEKLVTLQRIMCNSISKTKRDYEQKTR